MATIPLPPDFSEFLRLLGAHKVRYLLIGGYAVGYHGHVRGTADIDVWVDRTPENAERASAALREFGFDADASLIREPEQVIRMGTPPLRIEMLTSVSGVAFDECYLDREVVDWEGIEVSVISLEKLKQNKAASGRLKDLDELKSSLEAGKHRRPKSVASDRFAAEHELLSGSLFYSSIPSPPNVSSSSSRCSASLRRSW